MDPTIEKLLACLRELQDLSGVIGLVTWDQETYLPPKGEGARAHQLSMLQGLYHERLTAPALGELLAATRDSGEQPPDLHAMIRVLEWERRREIHVPLELVHALAEAQSLALGGWRQAREQRDFEPFRPHLARLVELRRQQADAIGYAEDRYDALLDGYEPGMTASRLDPVLRGLEAKLSPLVRALAERSAREANPLAGLEFDPERQWRFTLTLLADMGFDLQAGRQDRSIHPFTRGLHPTDVRLTTKLDPTNLFTGLFGTIHEGGHGLYEQGFAPEHHRTPLAAAPSMGLHESQSRLWENIVGRSRAFWIHYHPRLAREFPDELGQVDLDALYRAANRVRASLNRVEADEVTYNLHVVLRYGLERALLAGDLPVADLPGAWNQRTQELLGIRPGDDLEGVLQDIHWAWGEFGYFPTYALGNLYAASIWAALRREIPDVEEHIARGDLLVVREWLRARIHSQGYRYPAEELVRKVTGRGLTDEDFVAYLHRKYEALYGSLT